ncbi:HD domain-containing protein [Gemmata sp. JC717]|uniref:HD domain-containing protein n=1 Tax=Gemmata algarum TaxID=2975278 RepID=A0ABU5EXJ6_9BACT|nr:HD domain-containing protein [Gemmata algarum]MDY3554703.1 HD domain-containing protein [Gemmata algarum]MDY3559669.1 HD domain-containing protein [Gemmata algarum]
MSKAKKPMLAKLSDLQPGHFVDCFVQLAEKSRGTTQQGKPYIACKYRDARRTVGSVPIWEDSPLFADALDWQAGQFFKVRATYTEHEKYGPQLDIERMRPVNEADRADGFSELDFVERSRFDSEEMFADLTALVRAEVADAPLRALVLALLDANAAGLKAVPASTRHFYPFAGGWLEHTLAVARSCAWLADQFATRFPELNPPLNRGLVVAAAALHDIGRVRGVDMPPGQPGRPSVPGELLGHVFLGYEMIRTAAAGVPDLDPELLDLLLHCVVAHPRAPEWGTSRPPCIPEVLILHHADELDGRFEMYARCLARDTAEGPFTNRDPVLGRLLLKARKA